MYIYVYTYIYVYIYIYTYISRSTYLVATSMWYFDGFFHHGTGSITRSNTVVSSFGGPGDKEDCHRQDLESPELCLRNGHKLPSI